ncbi:MAG: ferrous iron transport protein B [Cytophagales bacterium]|nr:MAG: ferrous iron transport protein B [Cytophagales bacterium]
MREKTIEIALIGNPNSGKSSLFNHLTRLNQKIGNFPGVTVDKKTGNSNLTSDIVAEIIDLPGTYSLYPKSLDEQVVLDFIINAKKTQSLDLIIVAIDASNIKRNLLLYTQLADLDIPLLIVLNMMDLATLAGINIDVALLSAKLKTPVICFNGRTGEGIEKLKTAILERLSFTSLPTKFIDSHSLAGSVIADLKSKLSLDNDYQALILAHQFRKKLSCLNIDEKDIIQKITNEHNFQSATLQIQETYQRYDQINTLLNTCIENKSITNIQQYSIKIDRLLTHPVWGYAIFFGLLFLIFQSVFSWASIPMNLIDEGIATLNAYLKQILPNSMLTDLFTDGLIAGLGGILIFIPQIAILFFFIALLEESGYMSRVMFIMDRFLRKFGMNGRSVVPLISGVACAVPAIMATRSIDNWKNRLITIFVTPLMSCSARIPVFTIIIALAVPEDKVFGIFNLQGLTLMGLYTLGFLAAVLTGWILNIILENNQRSFLIMELPSYKMPRWNNIGFTIIEKIKTFVFDAGKVIISIAIILWVLASYGPSDQINNAINETQNYAKINHLNKEEEANLLATKKLEASYAGHLGKIIEPAIKPLGFDWKIGIALITSFAAREVFVSTMSTIYSVGSENQYTIKERMKAEINPETGKPMYSLALSLSLLVFYVFAMQCMSTIAVVYRETKTWKWPLLQFAYMSCLAYLASFAVYSLLK